MKFDVPRKFSVMGFEYKVELVDEIPTDEGAAPHGRVIFGEGRMLLRRPSAKWSEAMVEQTFCHEMLHAILWHLNEDELNDNERFVDSVASILHQALKTMK